MSVPSSLNICFCLYQVSVQKSGHSGSITLRPVALAMSFFALRIRSLQGQKPLIYKLQGFIAMVHKNLTRMLWELIPTGITYATRCMHKWCFKALRYVCPVHFICVETKDLLHMDSIHLRNVAFLKCHFSLSCLYVVPREPHTGSN